MRRLLLMILLFTSFLPVIRSQEYKNFRDLEEGDWLLIEMAEYYPYVAPGMEEMEPWRAENIRRSIFKATVTEIYEDNISFQYQLESVYDCRNTGEENGFLYYDSRYENDFSHSNAFSSTKYGLWSIGGQDITKKEVLSTVTYNLKTGQLSELQNNYKDLSVSYPRKLKSVGMRNDKPLRVLNIRSGSLNTARLLASGMTDLIMKSNEGALITSKVIQDPEAIKAEPMLMPAHSLTNEMDSEILLPCEIRVIGASFQLPPNIQLIYSDVGASDVITEMKLRKIFLPYPCKYYTESTGHLKQGYPWLVIPGDSIVRTILENKMPYFTGRGSEQNNQYYRCNTFGYNLEDKIKADEYPIDGKKDLFPGLTGFWKRSFELNMLYNIAGRAFHYYLYQRNVMYNTPEEPDWDAFYFQDIIPLTDGWYQPNSFERFLSFYLSYKNIQSATETLSAYDPEYNGVSGDDKKKNYYLNKYFLDGYPRQLMNARNLIEMMHEEPLSESNTEYKDFISQNPDQQMLGEVDWQRQLMESLQKETGNIMDTDMSLLKRVFSEYKFNKKYIIIWMTSSPQSADGEMLYPETLYQLLEEKELLTKTDMLFINPEKSASYIETDRKRKMKDYFFHAPQEEIIADLLPFDKAKHIVLLMRNDGTILAMKVSITRKVPPEEIISDIEADMNRKRSDFSRGFYKGLFTTLAIGFFVLMFLKLYWDRKQRKERQRRQIKELELKAIRSQMNPHFIFNALGSIQNLLGKGANEEANDYLVRFSRLLRTVLNNSEKKLVPLSGEIEQLYLYLALEQLRFPFVYTIEIDETLETELIEIPGMLIQPFVENAVKHAIAPRGTGNIHIIITQTDYILHVIIQDDGPGLSSTASGGFGIKAVKDEIEILKKLYHTEVEINIINRQDNESCTGVKVMLAIPIG